MKKHPREHKKKYEEIINCLCIPTVSNQTKKLIGLKYDGVCVWRS